MLIKYGKCLKCVRKGRLLEPRRRKFYKAKLWGTLTFSGERKSSQGHLSSTLHPSRGGNLENKCTYFLNNLRALHWPDPMGSQRTRSPFIQPIRVSLLGQKKGRKGGECIRRGTWELPSTSLKNLNIMLRWGILAIRPCGRRQNFWVSNCLLNWLPSKPPIFGHIFPCFIEVQMANKNCTYLNCTME